MRLLPVLKPGPIFANPIEQCKSRSSASLERWTPLKAAQNVNSAENEQMQNIILNKNVIYGHDTLAPTNY
jgi:hypothetical protein